MIIGLAMLGYVAQEYVLKPKKQAQILQQEAEEAVQQQSLDIPPPPPEIEQAPPPVLSPSQLKRIRASTRDTNPDVRLLQRRYVSRHEILLGTRVFEFLIPSSV